jgi:hypothetical protein
MGLVEWEKIHSCLGSILGPLLARLSLLLFIYEVSLKGLTRDPASRTDNPITSNSETNTKFSFQETLRNKHFYEYGHSRGCTGSIWLRIGTSGGLL